MKKRLFIFCALALSLVMSCSENANEDQTAAATTETIGAGQSAVQDDASQKDIVKVAVGSPDHTTLVKALQSADLVNVLSNAGPFTVFAPTNAAFDKLPAGTLDGLMKEDKKSDLQNILEYHVSVGVYKEAMLQDGQNIGQVNGKNITITKQSDKIVVNGNSNVLSTIQTTNGIIYVVDQVLLPK